MESLKRNSYREALLAGRTFEVHVPYSAETCVQRLEKHAAAAPKFGLRFSKVQDGIWEFALQFGGFGVETVARGKLEDTGDAHTLLSGHMGSNVQITNIIIAFFSIVGFVLIFGSRFGPLTTIAFTVVWVVFMASIVVGRLRAYDSWLRWLLQGLESPSD